MKKISENIDYNFPDGMFTEEEKQAILKEQEMLKNMTDVERRAYSYNCQNGKLNLADNIDCPKCKNKGNIMVVDGDYTFTKDCECMKKRHCHTRLLQIGYTQEQLNQYQLKNFSIKEEWQKNLAKKISEYIKAIKEGKRYWLYLGGNTGCGKTHLSIGTIQVLIKQEMDARAFIWNTEIPKLIRLRKSFGLESEEKFNKLMDEYINCDVLYIDDFLQRNSNNEEVLSFAFEIINARYNNPKLITIISSEYVRDKLQDKIGSVFGRIWQKTDNGSYFINITGSEKDYRTNEEIKNN